MAQPTPPPPPQNTPQQQPPPQGQPQGQKPPPEMPTPAVPDGGVPGGGPGAHDCSDCTITRILPAPAFPVGRRTSLRVPLSVAATATYTLTAVPSDPLCPCEWNNRFQIAGHRIATGHTSLTRKTLNAGLSPLIETLRPRLDRLEPFFTVAGCALTINIQSLDQTLRQGIGLANNVVMIEMGLQVRCAPKGRWRNVRIVFSD